MKKLRNVLFISAGYPRMQEPINCPPIGYNLAFLRKKNIEADVLHLNKLNFKDLKSFFKKFLYFVTLFIPILIFDSYNFAGEKYRIFKLYYTPYNKILVLVFVYLLMKKNKYSIFHYHFLWFTQELVFLKKYLKVPSVISIRGSDLHETAVRDKFQRQVFKKAVENADIVIYVSKGLRKIAEKIGFTKETDVIINNGFDTDLFYLTKKIDKVPTLGFVGHLYRVKRVDKLPMIFNEIKKKIPDAKLIIVGGGAPKANLEEDMQKIFKKYNLIKDVKFIGEVVPSDLRKYYSKMDILLLPSREEGFGAVIIEARACGVPVVGTDVGGISEAIGNAGEIVLEGRGFEKRFANKVVKLFQNLPSRIKISKDVGNYKWENIIVKEINAYKKVLKTK